MIRANDRHAIRKPRRQFMPEWRQRSGIDPAKLLTRRKIRFKSNHSEGDNHTDALQPLKFLEQIRPAIRKFRRQRFVVGRRAMNGGGDIAIDQSQPISALSGCGTVRKAKIVKGTVKPIARTIAGENSSSPVPAMRCRRQPNDHKPSPKRAEARHGPSPIFAVTLPPHLRPCGVCAIAHKWRPSPYS